MKASAHSRYCVLLSVPRDDAKAIIRKRSLKLLCLVQQRPQPHVPRFGRRQDRWHIAFGWIGSTGAFGAAVRNP